MTDSKDNLSQLKTYMADLNKHSEKLQLYENNLKDLKLINRKLNKKLLITQHDINKNNEMLIHDQNLLKSLQHK